jgi:hypothetical protein
VNLGQSARRRKPCACGWLHGKETTFIGLDAVRQIRCRTTRNEDTRCYFCKNNCLRTFIDVGVSGATSQAAVAAPVVEDRAATPEEIAAVVNNLPSLEQIESNLPAATHGSSCSTGHAHDHGGGGCGCESSSNASFRAKAEPLVQILAAPGAKKPVEAPKLRANSSRARRKFPCAWASNV